MTTPPQKLGRYEVLEEIGKGAMGVVYVARDPLIGRQVALKTFRVGFSAKDQELQQFRNRFVREAQSAGILSHPNIVTIHDVIDEGGDGVCFIAMEFVKGTNLKQLLQRSEPFSHGYVVNVISQIAEALDYAHSRGVVHRDIKPANILITPEDKVKITDFGIARLDTSNLTMEGQLLGTPNYMAPEQIQGKEVDHRADIFSLGVVFYEMLTRKKPFQGENLTAVTHKIVYEPFTPPEDLVADLPAGLAAVLRRCLEKDPNRRYPRASEIAAELKKSWSKASAEDEDTSATQEVAEITGEGADETVEKTVDSTRPAPGQAPRAGSSPPVSFTAQTVRMAQMAQMAQMAPLAATPPAASAPPQAGAPAPRAAAVPSLPTPAVSIPITQSSGEMQVQAALRRIRNQRMVQWGLVAVAALAAIAIVALWASDREPAPDTAAQTAVAAEEARTAGIAAALGEARSQMQRGDLRAALQSIGRVESADPANAEARALRLEIENATRALSQDLEREQRIGDGLALAREELGRKRYDAAATAAKAVLELAPGHEEATKIVADSQAAMARARERERAAKSAPPAGATQSPPAAAPPAATVAKTVQPSVAPVGDARLAISFFSEASEGVLTIYAGERQIVREPFKFVRKTGFLRSEKISGNLSFARTLPAGAAALRVYVSVPGRPTKAVLVEGDLAGGSNPTLDVKVDAEGRTTATLQ